MTQPQIQTYDTVTLSGVIYGIDPNKQFLLNMFFPGMMTFQTKGIAFDKILKSLKLAPFVSPLVQGKIQRSRGSQMTVFEPAYLKPKDVVDPDRPLVRRSGEPLGGNMSPMQRRDAIIADILQEHRNQIYRRFEHMASEVLLTGKTIVTGEDYPTVEVDFGRKPQNTIALTGAARWSEPTADPLNDIEDWGTIAEAPITVLIMDSQAYRNFIRNDKVAAELLNSRRGSATQLEAAPGNGEVVSYKGSVGGNIDVYVYAGFYEDDDGNKVNFIPENTVIAASRAVDGVKTFGAILDPQSGYQALELFPKNWISQDPAAEYVMTQSAPLMVPRHVNAIVRASV